MTGSRKKKMDLKNAYLSFCGVPSCLYCGVCLVDGPTPDAEIWYLFCCG